MIASISIAARDSRASRSPASHQPGQIAGGSKSPFVGDADQIDTARGIIRLQLRQRRLDVDAIGHPLGEGGLIDAVGSGEQQGFEQPQFLGRACGSIEGSSASATRFSARLAMARSPSSTYSAWGIVSGAVIASDTGCGGRFRKYKGANASFWCILISPSRTSSRAAAKLEANTVAFCEGSTT